MRARWSGSVPFEETFFIEAVSGDRGLWIRHRIDAERAVSEVWVILTTRDGVVTTHKSTHPLEPARSGIFECPDARLTADRATGSVGSVHWDLRIGHGRVHHRHMPWWLAPLGVGKHYHPESLDAAISGEVRVGEEMWKLDAAPGVVGHLWGAGSRVRSWAWSHCNAFDHSGAVFEGLAAQIGRLPVLTSLVLRVDGKRYRFSRTRDLFRTWTRLDRDRWVFQARRKDTTLSGTVELSPSTAAVVTYPGTGPGGTDLYCTNSRFAALRLVLTDPTRRLDIELSSSCAAFERVTDERPNHVDL